MAIPVGAVGLGSTTNKHSPSRRLRKCQFGLVHSSNTGSLAFCACVNIESHGRKRLSPVYTHTRNQLLLLFFPGSNRISFIVFGSLFQGQNTLVGGSLIFFFIRKEIWFKLFGSYWYAIKAAVDIFFSYWFVFIEFA